MPLRFLALGDSYTIGESVAESESWPFQMVEALKAQGILIEPPQIIAQTGWTTDELLKTVDAAQINPPYQLISLLIGVNNQYRGYSREEYRRVRRAAESAVGFADGDPKRVLVVSIPIGRDTLRGAVRSGECRQRDRCLQRDQPPGIRPLGARYVDVDTDLTAS